MKIKTNIVQTETPPLQKAILDLIIINSDQKKEDRKKIKSPIRKKEDKKSRILSILNDAL